MRVDAANALLGWYAVDKRRLPWRAEAGERADPYRVWLSEVMLQQTRAAAVAPYYEAFTRRWPTVAALAAATDEEVMRAWAGLGYYARARNLLACARTVVSDHGGAFPGTEAELARLPGIGRYTSAAIAAIAFGRRAVVVDGNVERVVARLFGAEKKSDLYPLADSLTPAGPSGDFAQAMMDLGSAICTPRAPACPVCPLAPWCSARASGDPERYPAKAAKEPRPSRAGTAYWLEHDRHVLLVKRPPRGLLGGMNALPSDAAPADAAWEDAGSVAHVFTHFTLDMRLLCANASERSCEGLWWPVDRLGEAGLPSLYAKLAARGQAWRAVAERPAPLAAACGVAQGRL